jgi:hypothetical protein
MLFTYYANKVTDHITGVAALTPEAHLHIGLSSTEPDLDGTNITEPSGNGYARVQATNDDTTWDAAAEGDAASIIAVTFDQATGAWGDPLLYAVVWEAGETEPIWFSELPEPLTVANTDQPTVPVGSMHFIST